MSATRFSLLKAPGRRVAGLLAATAAGAEGTSQQGLSGPQAADRPWPFGGIASRSRCHAC